jgi:Ferritin-like
MELNGRSSRAVIPFVHERLNDLDRLRLWIQTAIRLEFTTVPAYLTALYSMLDKTSEAYQAVRSVVVEEMFHVNQIANLFVAIGGIPKFTGDAAPIYPSYLPSASRASQLPYVGLYRASIVVFQEVFMAIEMPAPFAAPAQGEQYRTIGQFYKAIEQGLEICVEKYGSGKVFQQDSRTRQRCDIYLGKFGGQAVEIDDLQKAKFAIRQIVEQGEGAVDPTRALVSDEPWGTYLQYGQRLDGTYGPILGSPYELSHYFKFKRVSESGPFPGTYPIVSNPRISDFGNPRAKQLAVAFNRYYSVMLNSLEKSFFKTSNQRDPYFEVTLPLMHTHLPQIATQLVSTPVMADGDPTVGPNATPTFEYESGSTLKSLEQTLLDLDVGNERRNMTSSLFRSTLESTSAGHPAAVVSHRSKILDGLARGVNELRRRSDDAGFGL